MIEITKEDKMILNNQTVNTLHEWRCLLNNHNWPEKLPNEEIYKSYKDYKPNGRRAALLKWISEHTGGHREGLYYYNVVKLKRMTEREFDIFYSGMFLGHRGNYRKDSYRSWKRINDDGSPPPEKRFKAYRFIWRLIFMFDSVTARRFTEKAFG